MKLFSENIISTRKYTIGNKDYYCFELPEVVIVFKNDYFTKLVHTTNTNDILELLAQDGEQLTEKFDYKLLAQKVNPNKRAGYVHD